MVVNHEDMAVPQGSVAVGMPVRRRAFPAVVGVLMMFVVLMGVVMLHGGMLVPQLRRISRGPETPRRYKPREGAASHYSKRNR